LTSILWPTPSLPCSAQSLNPRHARSRCPAACCYRLVPSAFTASINAPTGSSCRWTGVGAAMSCLRYTPHLRREALARCCSSRQIRHPWAVIYCTIAQCTCTVLFAVPDFPGNLAVFIPGKSGMKKSGYPGRPGNGSPGVNSLHWIQHITFTVETGLETLCTPQCAALWRAVAAGQTERHTHTHRC